MYGFRVPQNTGGPSDTGLAPMLIAPSYRGHGTDAKLLHRRHAIRTDAGVQFGTLVSALQRTMSKPKNQCAQESCSQLYPSLEMLILGPDVGSKMGFQVHGIRFSKKNLHINSSLITLLNAFILEIT